METEFVDIEEAFYLETLKQNHVYKEFLFNLNDDEDYSVVDIKRVSIKKIINIVKSLNIQIKERKKAHLIPILTISESEKSYLYDSIKDKFQDQIILQIPLCPTHVRVFYHIFSSLLEDLGLEVLETVNLETNKYNKIDAINLLMDSGKFITENGLIKKWFLGDELTFEEKIQIGVTSDVFDDENSLEMIKCISDSFKDPILLFFDDIESIYHKYGEDYGEKWGPISEMEFLKKFYQFFLEIKNTVIFLPCIKRLWNNLLFFSNRSLRSELELNFIYFYNLEGLKKKILKVMDCYWLQNNVRPPSNPFFPLNDELLEILFEKSFGNIRKFFFLYVKTITNILDGNDTPTGLH